MKGLLVGKDDNIKIKIFVGNDKNDEIFAHDDKNALLEYEVDEKTVEQFDFTFRRPSYRDEVDLVSGNVVVTDMTGLRIDPAAIRYKRMVSLLKDWSLKDQDGKKIPVNPDNVDRLHPKVAGAILNVLDERLS